MTFRFAFFGRKEWQELSVNGAEYQSHQSLMITMRTSGFLVGGRDSITDPEKLWQMVVLTIAADGTEDIAFEYHRPPSAGWVRNPGAYAPVSPPI